MYAASLPLFRHALARRELLLLSLIAGALIAVLLELVGAPAQPMAAISGVDAVDYLPFRWG